MEDRDAPLDGLYAVLADHRRRAVLDHLLDAEGGTATLPELAAHVVEAEAYAPGPDPDAVAIDLHHRHLPRLAEAGLVDWDRRSGAVRFDADSPAATALGDVFEAVDETEE